MIHHRSITIFVLCMIALVSCTPNAPITGTLTPQTPINRLEQGMMDATDLPFGWGIRSTGAPRDLNGATFAWYRDYQGPPRNAMPFVRAGQIIYLYSSEIESRGAYQELVNTNFPPVAVNLWPHPKELAVTLRAEENTIGCMSGSVNDIPHQACRVIARYGALVMKLDGQVFEDRWLTMEQFRHLLERVDAKMEKIREPQADSAPTKEP